MSGGRFLSGLVVLGGLLGVGGGATPARAQWGVGLGYAGPRGVVSLGLGNPGVGYAPAPVVPYGGVVPLYPPPPPVIYAPAPAVVVTTRTAVVYCPRCGRHHHRGARCGGYGPRPYGPGGYVGRRYPW